MLEEAPLSPLEQQPEPEPRRRLLPLSARTEKALDEVARRWVEFLGGDTPAWGDVCHTAGRRREHHDCRLTVLAYSPSTAAKLIEIYLGATRRTRERRRTSRFGAGGSLMDGTSRSLLYTTTAPRVGGLGRVA